MDVTKNTSFLHHLYTSISGYAILPLRYLSSTKARKRLGFLSAKVSANSRFLHLLRFRMGRPGK